MPNEELNVELIRNRLYTGELIQQDANKLVPGQFRLNLSNNEETVVGPQPVDEDGDPVGEPPQYSTSDAIESKVFEADQLSDEEREQFGLENVPKGWMLYGRHLAWHARIYQLHELQSGAYTLSIPVFTDIYDWDDEKIPPNLHFEDPRKRAMRLQLHANGHSSGWFDEATAPPDMDWYLNHYILSFDFTITEAEIPNGAEALDARVGLEAWVPWPIKNTGLVLGPWSLRRVGEGGGGGASVGPLNYRSTSFVLHPKASRETAHEVLDMVWDKKRTICLTPGDAAKLGGDINLVNWPAEERDAYEEFYELYANSPVQVQYVETSTSNWDRFLLSMKDPEWANVRYAGGRCYTIGSQGCWVACSAMAQRVFGIKHDATPLTVDETLGSRGYTDSCLMLWERMKKLGLNVKERKQSAVEARDALPRGDLLFIEVAPTSLMHFVLGVDYDIERHDFYVLDPLTNKAAWLTELYPHGWESFRIVGKLDGPHEPIYQLPDHEPTRLLSMHAQHDHEGLKKMADHVGAVKIVEDAGTMDQFAPETFVVWRNWLSKGEIHHYANGTPLTHFNEQIRPFIDQHYEALKNGAVEDGMNERIGPSDRDENKRMIDWFLETTYLVDSYTDGEIKTVGLNPGPGAFPLKWIGDFYDVFKRCHEHGDYVGLHTYIPVNFGKVVDFWQHVAMQVVPIFEWCKNQGFYDVKFLGTEHGYIGGRFSDDGGFHMDASAGWAHDLCLAGDWLEHKRFDVKYGNVFWQWNKNNGYPLRYLFYFTVMHMDEMWKKNFPYYTKQFEDLQAIADQLYADWV